MPILIVSVPAAWTPEGKDETPRAMAPVVEAARKSRRSTPASVLGFRMTGTPFRDAAAHAEDRLDVAGKLDHADEQCEFPGVGTSSALPRAEVKASKLWRIIELGLVPPGWPGADSLVGSFPVEFFLHQQLPAPRREQSSEVPLTRLDKPGADRAQAASPLPSRIRISFSRSSTKPGMAARTLTNGGWREEQASARLPADSSSAHWPAFFLILSIFDATLFS